MNLNKSFNIFKNITSQYTQIQNKFRQIRKATHKNTVVQVRSKNMASAVTKQPLSSPKSEKEDSKTVNKILPGEKTLNKMNPDEKNLEKIQPDRGFLRKVSPTSDVVVKLLEGV